MEQYLKEHYYDEIENVLNDSNDRTYASLHVDLSQLQQHNFGWFQAILDNVYDEMPKWSAALFAAQKSIASEDEGFLEVGYQIKVNCTVRFVHIPPPDPRFKLPFPNNDQVGLFRELKGTVVRMSQIKLLEIKREFVCSKCSTTMELEADYSLMYRFDVPKNCSKAECKGNFYQKNLEPLPQHCVNFQELKIQEALSEKNIPPTLAVTLDSDLVDSCQPGDFVTICGTIERRWISFQYEGNCEAVIAMRAVSLTREQHSLDIDASSLSEQMMTFKADWIEHLNRHGELGMRDIILKSICPDVYGLYPVKLAIVLAICSVSDVGDHKLIDGLNQRGQSHVLMVGDPGLAKSKLLLSATQIAPRAVHTTGMGCSSAGLTAAAIKEDGEWVLEAGALVLADGGICCIDEFNLMRESDKASIHEAMEQQTISMAKAGIVCKLNTRCAILAAANPKNLHAMSEPDSTSSVNIGIATPLLSRFDLVFILRDERIPEWDDAIADHLLAQVTTGFKGFQLDGKDDLWSTQKLKSHFAAISQIQPKLTPIASEILSAYYRKCRSDPERDPGRTTIRLLDSLNRLAEAHARLVFREEITAIDAIITVRLMESTFGFGRLVKPYDVIKEKLPIGPEHEEIESIFDILDIDDSTVDVPTKGEHSSEIVKSQNAGSSTESSQHKSTSQVNQTQIATNPSKSMSKATTQSPTLSTLKSFEPSQSKPSTSRGINVQPVIDIDADELSEILSFDNIEVKKTTTTEDPVADDEDLFLSQVCDDIERRQTTSFGPAPKIQKIDHNNGNRPKFHLNLSRFAFKPTKSSEEKPILPSSNQQLLTSSENKPKDQQNIQLVNKAVQNRILCTPSDDEMSQNEAADQEPPKRPPLRLSFLKTPLLVSQRSNLHQQNAAISVKGDGSQKENDSAYDTMSFSSSGTPGTFGSAANTGKTPPLFASSGQTQNNTEEDLSCLDSIEFE